MLVAGSVYREPVTTAEIVAMLLLLVGIALVVRSDPGHRHEHRPVEHTHEHRHDAHPRNHHHAGGTPERHSRLHGHQPVTHGHPHLPDLHHRHEHPTTA